MTGFDTLQEYQTAFNEYSSALLEELTFAFEQWSDYTQLAMQAAGTSMEGFRDTVDESIYEINQDSQSAINKTGELGNKMISTYRDILSQVDNFENNYGGIINSVITNNKSLIDSCNDLVDA